MRSFLRRSLIAPVLLLLTSASCGGSQAQVADASPDVAVGPSLVSGTGLDQGAGTTTTTVHPVAASFGDDELRALDQLQVAIDMHVESRVVDCMAREGFEYVPLTVAQIQISLRIDIDPSELQELVDAGEIAGDPNEAIVASLTEKEQERWNVTQGDCLVEESIPHPLAKSGTWFSGAEQRASQRVVADPRFIAAEQGAEACRRDLGYDDLEQQFAVIDDAGQQVVFEQIEGAISMEQALQRLDVLATQQEELWDVDDTCNAELLRVEGELFFEYFAEIAEREELLAAEWSAEVRETLRMFHEELAYLLDD